MNDSDMLNSIEGIAIIGMAGKFPGAGSIEKYWQNIIEGIECISFYTDDELLEMGIAQELLSNPKYVKARGHLEDIDKFDAAFFGISPKEAEVMDPQHRICLECAWEALEDAGYDSERYDGRIGVFAGESMNTYLLLNVYPTFRDKVISAGSLQAAIGNDKDSLTTTISYKMNLTGASITVQSSSSTSLTAICVACQSLLNYQCDMALSGGVSVGVPKKNGYLYEEGGIVSPDGHCRPFDAESKGFVPGNGVGMVVLKRLSEAIEDGDYIYAVIKGFAVNNDGSNKVSYSAPSVDAQAEVIAEAQAIAGFNPETIGYVEAHGTGTQLGDPIEVAALTKAFRSMTDKTNYCALGSVKGNIGHLDTAAGVAGLIKASLALRNKTIPPNINFKKPNPKIDFDSSPFYVNTKPIYWKEKNNPRRAGVTSLGMGGTNAHVVLEEAPEMRRTSISREWKLLMLSAKTPTALHTYAEKMADFLECNPGVNLADAAYTMQLGRRVFPYRHFVLCREKSEGVTELRKFGAKEEFMLANSSGTNGVVFMFSGQGTQYVNMTAGLYKDEKVFREQIDKCAGVLEKYLQLDIRDIIYPEEDEYEEADELLNRTKITQPALFCVEYAAAKTLMHWGIKPNAMIGHSIGEYVAACIAGVLSLEDALMIVSARGELMNELPEGSMLAVRLSEGELQPYLTEQLSLAAVNAPSMTVLSGTDKIIDTVEQELKSKGVFCSRLRTSHAFHSYMMDPMLEAFEETVKKAVFNPPKIPYVSCLTGNWAAYEDISNTGFWTRHIRETVRFADGLQELFKEKNRIFLEVGPGNTLCSFVKQYKQVYKELSNPISSIRGIKDNQSDTGYFLTALGALWVSGVRIDWSAFYEDEVRNRIPLPKYPFERKRYWIGEEVCKKIDETDKEMLEESAISVDMQQKVWSKAQIKDKVREIWKELLGFDEIGNDDNFFSIGGDSIMLIRLQSKIDECFPNKVSITDLFALPTIAKQSLFISEGYEKESGEKGNVRKNNKSGILESDLEKLIRDVEKGDLALEEAIESFNALGG